MAVGVFTVAAPACSDDKGPEGEESASKVPPGEFIVGEGAGTCRAASEDPIFAPQPEVAYLDQMDSVGVCQIGFTLDSDAMTVFHPNTTGCGPREEFLMPFRPSNGGWVLHPDTADLVPDLRCGP